MAQSSHSPGHHDHEHHGDLEHNHEHNPHDWASPDYVSNWARGQDPKERDREEAFSVLAKTIPFDKPAPIKILDMGAGYGALTKFLLERFPNATAICQDGSEEMAKLGHERMKEFKGRVSYVIADFSRHGWSTFMPGPFEAIVSSIAIHNVGSPNIIHGIYEDAFSLVKPGGCFLNFDRSWPPWEDQMKWLSGAGFANVKIFWQGETRAVFGGFRNT